MKDTNAPKVFISHASEDKARFVLAFATHLRNSGIDAWLDKWEMLPGDSLVDKIFDHGIGQASALVIVLSHNSVKKPWVREEMNAAFVKRVQGQCKLIPVCIDDCAVPECLSSTLWERIDPATNYDEQLRRVVNAVYGTVDRPPLGTPPPHTANEPLVVPHGLSRADAMVFEAICEQSVEEDDPMIFSLDKLDRLLDIGMSEQELTDGLAVLEEDGLVEGSKVLGGGYRGTGLRSIRIATHAFDEFARAKWPEYNKVFTQIVSGICNLEWSSSTQIDGVGGHSRLRDQIVRLLHDQGMIHVSRYMGGYHIMNPSPRLRRMLE